jgi:hypothetical protein
MKTICILLLSAMLATSCSPNQTSEAPKKMLRHVVLFKFTDSSTPDDVKKVEDAFVALKGKISQVKDFEWGKNSSPENLNQGLTHCFFATFYSDKDRDDYLVHPDHQAFVEVLKPYLDKVTVIDYWTE